MAAEAEGADSAGELVEAVEVEGVEGVVRGEGFAGTDSAAFASASERRAAAAEMVGGGMPRRWQMKKTNSASVRSAPLGMEWQRRRDAAPLTVQARMRAMACGAAREAVRVVVLWRASAWAKTDWQWRLASRRMLLIDGLSFPNW